MLNITVNDVQKLQSLLVLASDLKIDARKEYEKITSIANNLEATIKSIIEK